MKVLIVGANGKRRYSGGRYHAWILAQSLVASDNTVHFWTNNRPIFLSDFASNKLLCRVSIDLSLDYKAYKSGDYDIVIIIPDHSPLSGIYEKAVLSAKFSSAKLVLLNFETPNWFNSMSPVARPEYFWVGWNYVARYASLILSSTRVGMKFARAYFTNSNASHAYAYPAINEPNFEGEDISSRERQAVVITRFDKHSLHKGGAAITEFFCERFSNYSFIFIGLKDNEVISELVQLAEKFNITINAVNNISDDEKFRILAKSELSIFLSEFEGFGYPPLESLSVGTPCVVRPLPVIKETCGSHATYLPVHLDPRSLAALNVKSISSSTVAEFKEKFSFRRYGEQVSDHLSKVDRVYIGNMGIAVSMIRLSIMYVIGVLRFIRGKVN